MFHIGAYSDIGPRKASNQDSCCALVNHYTLEDASGEGCDSALLAVCDGVGGFDSGEVASATVINWLVTWFEDDYPRLLAAYHRDTEVLFNAVEAAWRSNLMMLNAALGSLGDEKGARMGTTCTAALLVDGRVLIGHIGDTRVYRFRNSVMQILTEDQSWVAREVARGNIPPEKARFHPKRNIILQSVGTQPDLKPEFYRSDYRSGDAFMVCCDGFRNELFDDELVSGFGGLQEASDQEIAATCKRLTDLVQSRDERDNVTAVAAVYSEGTDYGAPVIDVPEVFLSAKAGE